MKLTTWNSWIKVTDKAPDLPYKKNVSEKEIICTAPTKKALISHYKSYHQAELAKESPAFRKEIFGMGPALSIGVRQDTNLAKPQKQKSFGNLERPAIEGDNYFEITG